MAATARVDQEAPPFTIHHVDHIVLRVRHLEKSANFYAALGGHEIPRSRDNATSLLLAGETRVTLVHHSGRRPPDDGNLDHINLSIEARDISTVAEYLEAHGARVQRDLGRQPRAPTTVRVLDPDDNVIELRLHQPDGS